MALDGFSIAVFRDGFFAMAMAFDSFLFRWLVSFSCRLFNGFLIAFSMAFRDGFFDGFSMAFARFWLGFFAVALALFAVVWLFKQWLCFLSDGFLLLQSRWCL